MKNLKYLFMAALVVAGLSSCNNEDDFGNGGNGEGKETYAQLKINQPAPGTYAAEGVTENAEAYEVKLASTLDVYIFSSAGVFETKIEGLAYDENSSLTNSFKTTSGEKYFYVFSHKLTDGFDSPEPGGMNRVQFEKEVLKTVVDTNNATIDMAKANEFMIGTLWGKRTSIPEVADGQTARVILEVGRAAAKVDLVAVKNKVGGNLQGTFDVTQTIYRLRSIATEFYLVGQYSGSMPPAAGAVVTSAVHEEAPYKQGSTTEQNPKFVNNEWGTASYENVSFYAVENTTKKDAQGSIYYGNTTFIQLKVKYNPKGGPQGEVCDLNLNPDELDPAGDGTFYTALVDGVLYIFNENPQGATIPGLDDTSIKEYEQGINYYNIAVEDPNEEGVENSCRILRNHYYEMSVNSISNLGEPTDYVDPGKEIPEDKDVEIEVRVLNWSKVSQGIDL